MRSKELESASLPWWTYGVIAALFSVLLFAVGNAFSDGKDDASTVATAATSSSASAASDNVDLDSLSAEQKRDLLRRKQQFDQLTTDEQTKLRQFHSSLTAEPDAVQLTAVMTRYHQWLMSLKPLERDELLSLTPEERIARIKRILQQQEKERFEQMAQNVPPEDLQVIYTWIDKFILEHQDKIVEKVIANMPPDARARWEGIKDPEHQRRWLMFAINHRAPNAEGLAPQKEDFDRLVPQLSKQSQEVLRKAEVPGDILRNWVRAAVMSKVMPPVTDEQLTEFQKELPLNVRQELEGLAREEVRERLTKMYYAAKFNRAPRPWLGPGQGGWRDGRGPDGQGSREGRPGDGRGPDGRGEGRGPNGGPPGEGRPSEGRPGPPGEGRPLRPMSPQPPPPKSNN
jgi:hypothetical protein